MTQIPDRNPIDTERRCLVAFSTLVVLNQAGWLTVFEGGALFGALRVTPQAFEWLLVASFLYFAARYHQLVWPLDVRSTLRASAQARHAARVCAVAEARARARARPDERYVCLAEGSRVPDAPLDLRRFELSFRFAASAESSDVYEAKIVVDDPKGRLALRSLIDAALLSPLLLHRLLPSVLAAGALVMLLPGLPELFQSSSTARLAP